MPVKHDGIFLEEGDSRRLHRRQLVMMRTLVHGDKHRDDRVRMGGWGRRGRERGRAGVPSQPTSEPDRSMHENDIGQRFCYHTFMPAQDLFEFTSFYFTCLLTFEVHLT